MSNFNHGPAVGPRLHSDPPLFESLSARETEVLAMTAEGLTNGEVASRLLISVHAVKFHLASVYRKLGVTNRTEAAVTYLRANSSPRKDVAGRS